MTLILGEEKCDAGGTVVSVSVIGLENASIVLVTDNRNQYRVGAIALATPTSERIGQTGPTAVTLIGEDREILAKVLAAKTSADTGKMALSIVGLREYDNEAAASIMKTVQNIVSKSQRRFA
ncbi:MAG: hypothetical protein WED05_03420 [Candidatus Atabeyarchaeum deiterrae]|jgi:hypothetical protein